MLQWSDVVLGLWSLALTLGRALCGAVAVWMLLRRRILLQKA